MLPRMPSPMLTLGRPHPQASKALRMLALISVSPLNVFLL